VSPAPGGLGDALLRLLGADPETFRPLYRVQKLLLARGTRIMARRKKRQGLFANGAGLLYLYATIYGLMFVSFLLASKSPLFGAAIALTIGSAFLLMIVITDHFDVLVNPREALILGAHPHDGRSFLLAKVAAVVRTLSLLALLLFLPAGIATGFVWRSWLASAAFLAGAAGAGLATALCGLLLGAVLLRMGGKAAVERLLPWLQGAFQIGYLFVIGGPRLVRMLAMPPRALGALGWALPAFWFLAPLELIGRGAAPAPLARLGLAAGTLALLVFGATRWLGAGLSERLLEPPARTAGPGGRQTARRRALRGGGGERARLFAILRLHLRSDWRTRSEFLLVPLMGTFFILFYFRSFSLPRLASGMPVFFYCWMLVLSSDVLTRGSNPDSLWWILTAPIDRARFSLATVTMVRAFHLAPLFAALTIVEVRAGGSWPYRLALLVELLALGDVLIVLGKALFPDFPFSRIRMEGGGGGSRAALTLVGGLVGGAATALTFGFGRFEAPGALAGAALFALLHIPAVLWARRRAAASAEELELASAPG
jgi:hypothetical protein